MRIKKFWADGYRSLRGLELDNLGPFNIFYGNNGSGKSNILAAMATILGCVQSVATEFSLSALFVANEPLVIETASRAAGSLVMRGELASVSDFSVGGRGKSFVLGAIFVDDERFHLGGFGYQELLIEVELSEVIPGEPRLRFLRLELEKQTIHSILDALPSLLEPFRALLVGVAESYLLVPAERSPRKEREESGGSAHGTVRGYLRAGNLKRALFVASTSIDPGMRRRFREFRSLMGGPPLHRPAFDVVHDPNSGVYDIREPLGHGDVSIDQIGLGLAQAYAILAGVLLGNAGIVAIEEPEAHLHAPSLGRDVRALLERVVKENKIQQLFIASHSNLFDLDPDGYWNVAIEDQRTKVERKPLDEIDRLHLFEPGPAKHQLQVLLRDYGEEVVFRDGQGRTWDASRMLAALQRGDDEALAFLEAMHGAALQVTGLRARRTLKTGETR